MVGASLEPRRGDYGCCCRCCCCGCTCCGVGKVEYDVQDVCVAFFCFPSPIPLFLPLQPFLSRAFPARLSWLPRHTFRRPRAVRRCGPLSIRTHQAFRHHVMCLLDTSFSSFIEFIPFFVPTQFSCVVISPSPSCPSWASTFLSSLRSS